MSNACKNCGCTESQVIADAKTLGLQQEYESRIYTCCQIAECGRKSNGQPGFKRHTRMPNTRMN
jgi:hypothetical protein